jgi:hypothetical protein
MGEDRPWHGNMGKDAHATKNMGKDAHATEKASGREKRETRNPITYRSLSRTGRNL